MTEQHRLAAVVSANIGGYSKLVGGDETGTLEYLQTEQASSSLQSHPSKDEALRAAWGG